MNLNKSLKQLIIQRFKAGESMTTIADWYGKTFVQIETVIRDHLLEQDKVELGKEKIIGGDGNADV